MNDWTLRVAESGRARYLAIADAIEAAVTAGHLAPGDRLLPQRRLATALGVDFTTAARGYGEAARRGLIDSVVGRGSFVLSNGSGPSASSPRTAPIDLTMNLPPDPDDPVLIQRMQAGMEDVARNLIPLLHYQSFGGSPQAKDAASSWLGRRSLVPSQERLFITPGAHPALTAIFAQLARAGETVLCETITYPGMRNIALMQQLSVLGLPSDADGVLPEALLEACAESDPKLLYLNPTLQNPTTRTIPTARREALAEIARRYRVPIVEDDAYGFIPPHAPPPFAALVPELTWHVAGLAKCFGAGLRIAYVIAPDAPAGWTFSSTMRAATVMASPITAALATRWIEDGTGDAILRFLRAETAERQKMAADILPPGLFEADPLSFNLWMQLPQGWTRSAFAGHMRSANIGIVTSDGFVTGGLPPEAVRICLGGATPREALRPTLQFMAHALVNSCTAGTGVL